MFKKCMNNKQSKADFILLSLICLFLLTTVIFFVYAHHDHDCQSRHCAICEEFQNIWSNQRKLSVDLFLSVQLLLFLLIFTNGYIIDKYKYIVFETPIGLKVRLNH